MASYQSTDRSTIIDLQIDNLKKEKEILELKETISQLEGRQTTGRDIFVTNVRPSGQVELNVQDGAVPRVSPQPPAIRVPSENRESKIVRIATKQHASSFYFEQKDEWIKKLTEEVTDLIDEMRRRNCVAKAIKQNCMEITKNVSMQDGMFLDQLLSVRCLDDEERKLVAESRKGEGNQMRAVIVIVLKKDFTTILALVSCIRENNKDLAENIIRSYKDLASSAFGKEDNCWWCLLSLRLKFAIFVDHLLSKDLIDEELYNEASREDLSPGKRKELWVELTRQLLSHGNIRGTMECLRTAISDSEVHRDIVSLISLELDKNAHLLQCRCGPQMQQLKVHEYETARDGDSGHNTFAHSARPEGQQVQGECHHSARGEGQHSGGDENSSGFGASIIDGN